MSGQNGKESKVPQKYRNKQGRFIARPPGSGRPKGAVNKITTDIRSVIAENNHEYLSHLFALSRQEMRKKREMLKHELKPGVGVSLDATRMCAGLIVRCLPQLKTVDINIDETKRFMATLINLTGEDAVNYLNSGELPQKDGEDEV